MLVDFERVLLLLKRQIAEKNSHGQRDLLATIARLEAECAVDEAQLERHLRLVVAARSDALWPAPARLREDERDGRDDSPRVARDTTVPMEDHPDGSIHADPARARAAAAAAAQALAGTAA